MNHIASARRIIETNKRVAVATNVIACGAFGVWVSLADSWPGFLGRLLAFAVYLSVLSQLVLIASVLTINLDAKLEDRWRDWMAAHRATREVKP